MQRYTGKNFSFVKDSKGLADNLKGKSINTDDTLVSFDVITLFTSIPVPVAPKVIKRKLTDQISQEGMQDFLEHSYHTPKGKLITLLEVVLNNCVFSFQQKFYKQLQGAAMGSPVSPVIANIYIICIAKKDQVDILFNHISQMDAHIKFTMESPDSEGSIPFLDTKYSPNSNNTIHTTVYRKTTHIDKYLDWDSNHPTSAK